MVFEIPSVPDHLTEATLGALPVELFDQNLFDSNEVVHRYCRDCAIELYETLNLGPQLEQLTSVDDLLTRLGYKNGFRYALTWILRMLHTDQLLHREIDAGKCLYQQTNPLPKSERPALRKQCLEIDPHNEATLNLLDTAMVAYPAVAKGEIQGEQALFGMGELQLWLDFFHNDNTLYAINNRIAASAAAEAIEEKETINILEFGAGAGSASDALLEELAKRDRLDVIASYWVTEPNAFFHRKGQRLLLKKYPEVPFKIQSLDINLPWNQQLDFSSFDLIYSVNTLHVAKNIQFVLEQAKQHLQKGWLIAGECIRPFPQHPVYIEMIFQILDSFLDVDLDEEYRPQPGFLSPEQWRGWFEKSGYSGFSVKPDIEVIRESYHRFVTGVVCGYSD